MFYFLYFLICYAMASIVVEQKIFEEARTSIAQCALHHSNFILNKLCQLVNCTFCTGFWCGLFLTLTGYNIFNVGVFDPLYGALAGAMGSYTFHLIYLTIEYKLAKMGVINELPKD